MLYIIELINDTINNFSNDAINEPLNDSYKHAFYDTIIK